MNLERASRLLSAFDQEDEEDAQEEEEEEEEEGDIFEEMKAMLLAVLEIDKEHVDEEVRELAFLCGSHLLYGDEKGPGCCQAPRTLLRKSPENGLFLFLV